ncbi:MAG: colicin V production protein [Deltaproteobacteria bacterium]|nr:MAG: colicin V production protein [Deltaproteobacteria bacterium]
MDAGLNLTTYDFVVIAIFVFFVGWGLWLGFLRQISGLVALYLGYLMAGRYSGRLLPALQDIFENPKVAFLTTYAIMFFATFLAVMLVGMLLRLVIKITIMGWFDRLLGGLVGIAKAAICTVVMHMILGTVLAPENTMIRECTVCPAVNQITDVCRDVISDPELREALRQRLPAISIKKEPAENSAKTKDTASKDDPKQTDSPKNDNKTDK